MKTLRELMIDDMNRYLPTVWEYGRSNTGESYPEWLGKKTDEVLLLYYNQAYRISIENTIADNARD